MLQIAYTEESITSRRKKLRGGTGSVHQIEWCHMVAHARVCLPERRRKHYGGSTSGDLIAGLEVPDLSTEWQVSWKQKKALYGKKNLIPVGGKTKGAEEGEDDTPERKTDTTILPVCFHGMPINFYNEMIHTFYAKAVVDLTPLDGKFAWASLQQRVGYIGICFTDEHAELLYGHLRDLMRAEMGDPSSKLFNKEYAKSTGVLDQQTPEPAPPPKGKRGTSGRGRGRGGRRADSQEPPKGPEEKPEEPTRTEELDSADDDEDPLKMGGDDDVWDPLAED